MKFEIKENVVQKHSDLVSSVSWINNQELVSCGEDSQLFLWNFSSLDAEKIPNKLFGRSSKKTGFKATCLKFVFGCESKKDTFAVGGSDGNIYFCSKLAAKVESIEAHTKAVTCLSWDSDGNTLASGGEDGQLKIWTKSGIFRHLLLRQELPVLSLAWGPDDQTIAAAIGSSISIKTTASGQNQSSQWKAHDGLVVSLDWSNCAGKIVSAGTDHRYKVWTSLGDLLYSSSVHNHPLTSVSWCPDGALFAVGSFNLIKVCDELGWAHAASKPNTGSIYSIAWSTDGTQIAFSGSNGSVQFGHLTGARYVWEKYNVFLTRETQLTVFDETPRHKLDLPERPTMVRFAHNHLVVATASQLIIYCCDRWTSPVICDLPRGSTTSQLVLAAEEFLVVNTALRAAVYNYSGRAVATLNLPQLQSRVGALMPASSVSIGASVAAIRDRGQENSVSVVDTRSGKLLSTLVLPHSQGIAAVLVSQQPSALGAPFIAVLEKTKELWITPSDRADWKRVATMVNCALWHESCNFLAYVVDNEFQVLFCPELYYVDSELVPLAKFSKPENFATGTARSAPTKDDLVKQQLIYFTNSHCLLRNSDGSLAAFSCSADLMILLVQIVQQRRWEQALRICRFSKAQNLWAVLAGLSVLAGELGAAEVAYSQLHQTAKVEQICYINSLTSEQGRAAELALFCGKVPEAEALLISAQLYEQAVHMNLDLLHWDRALDLAKKFNTCVPDVLEARSHFLELCKRTESNKKYISMASAHGPVQAGKVYEKSEAGPTDTNSIESF